MAMRSGMYSSNKRKKELSRKKKQEEKRLKRQKSIKGPSQEDSAGIDPELVDVEPEASEDMSEVTEEPEVTKEETV